MIDRLINLKDKQLQCYEDFLKLQTRISIEYLPQNFDQLENFLSSDLYFPIIKDHLAVEFKQKRYKIIQEAKRTWLNLYIQAYQIKIQEYEHQYQQDLNQFELKNINHMHINEKSLLDSFNDYIDYRINRIKQDIYFEKLPSYHKQVLRKRQCLRWPKKMVTVNPTVILDILYHPFTSTQLAYLSRG